MKKLMVIVIGIMLFLAGCESKQEKQLQGSWNLEDSNENFATFKDGKIQAQNGDWSDYKVFDKDKNSIAITYTDERDNSTVDLNFKFDENDKDKATVYGMIDSVKAPALNVEKDKNSNSGMPYPVRWIIFIAVVIGIYYVLRALVNRGIIKL
ncbi:hypothetical protein CP553_11630 [Staphylococcus epidermidis]|uniref:hypothetical protein n=1 Tax=Staphylococcus epidermidis TaxID=1282 RepID=UPI000D582771|nr:hypothetical protein [Staphylococcus epidermidis]PVU46486.1 hypothetical protein CP553_11630 [Staphylococcus epidermidis]